MHRSFPVLAYEHNRCEIQKAIHKAFPAELSSAIFTGAMVHYFFTYLSEACPFGQHWDITMHLTVYLYAFDNLFSVRLQSAVKVVKIDLRYFGRSPVEEFGRKILSECIVKTFFLPSAYHV